MVGHTINRKLLMSFSLSLSRIQPLSFSFILFYFHQQKNIHFIHSGFVNQNSSSKRKWFIEILTEFLSHRIVNRNSPSPTLPHTFSKVKILCPRSTIQPNIVSFCHRQQIVNIIVNCCPVSANAAVAATYTHLVSSSLSTQSSFPYNYYVRATRSTPQPTRSRQMSSNKSTSTTDVDDGGDVSNQNI